jgi:hypothetical protein
VCSAEQREQRSAATSVFVQERHRHLQGRRKQTVSHLLLLHTAPDAFKNALAVCKPLLTAHIAELVRKKPVHPVHEPSTSL